MGVAGDQANQETLANQRGILANQEKIPAG